jgi:formylmethanofuran dehydrogenase subunit E
MEQIQAPWIGKGPEEREEKVVKCFCDYCDEPIVEDEEYYAIGNYVICTECINNFLTK